MNLVSPSPGARPMLCLKAVQHVSRCFPQVQSWDEAERSWRLGSKSDFSLKNYRPRSCSGPWRPCVNLKFCLSLFHSGSTPIESCLRVWGWRVQGLFQQVPAVPLDSGGFGWFWFRCRFQGPWADGIPAFAVGDATGAHVFPLAF